jgi:Cu2+-exporting ATPase/Cu+-exporting ATPase
MGVNIPEYVEDSVVEYRRQGYTVVFIGLNNVLAGLILLKDSIRRDSVELMEFLRGRKVRTVIASGDSAVTVEAVAKEVKVDEVYAELTPDDKVELVEKFQKNGLNVMFIGDGVNDAGAIGKSFLGIAVGGTDITKLAGDVVIMSEKLKDVENLIIFSERVRRKSLENLLWAFIYNLTLVPIAMGTLYNIGIILRPEMAATAMILSDISVILNSLTLLKIKFN